MMRWRSLAIAISITVFFVARGAECSPITISINTAALDGTQAQLAFDFIDGGPLANTVTINDFATDGTLGSSTITGGVSGYLPGAFTLSDIALFNELLTGITLHNSLSFVIDATNNALGSGVPDSFSFFLLDPGSGFPLFSTTDPTGSDALLQLDITGGDNDLALFNVPNGNVTISTGTETTPVPEPMTLVLLIAGIVPASAHFLRGCYRRSQA